MLTKLPFYWLSSNLTVMSGLEIWKKKLKACQHVLVQFINYRTSHFTFVAKTRRLAKWTRITNARGKGVKLLFFVLEYANFFFDPTVVMVQQDSRANSYDILMLTREFLDMLNAQWKIRMCYHKKQRRPMISFSK